MDQPHPRLRRELKLWDLIPMQVVLIVWLGWSGFAAKQGPTQAVLWLFAIVFFYIPLAAGVMRLSRSIPVEGGVYQWVKLGISPFAGYLAGWNLTVYAVTAFAAYGSLMANGFAYAAGPSGNWMLTSKPLTLAFTALACAFAYLFNARGLQLAKWWSFTGAVLTGATFLALLFLLIRAFVLALPTAHNAFSFAWPGFNILTCSVFARMAIGALSGFDNSAIFAEECRKPENDVARSVAIAAPLIALMYVISTSSILAYLSPQQVDVAAAVPQVMQAALGATALGRALVVFTAVAFNVSYTASVVLVIGAVARLPMVAGWDHLLPAWWSELHPAHRTPTRAIAAVSAAIFVLGVLSLIGAGNQEAVEVSTGAGLGALCIMYALLFGVILFGFRRQPQRPPMPLRAAALAAFLVALIALCFQIAPVGEVANRALFAIKVSGVILAANALGAFLYWRGARRASLIPESPATNA